MSGIESPLKNKHRRVLPNVPNRKHCIEDSSERVLTRAKSVTFNAETIETSIGGTQSYGHIKPDPLSPCNGWDFHGSSATTGSNLEMKGGPNVDNEENCHPEKNTSANEKPQTGIEKLELSTKASSSSIDSCKSDRPTSDSGSNIGANDASFPNKAGVPVIKRPLSKDSDEGSKPNHRRPKSLPRSKTLASGVKLDVLPNMSSPASSKSNNLLNLNPMGDSPTKIPVATRRSAHSYPDGQSPVILTPSTNDSVALKDSTPQALKPQSLSRSALFSPLANGTPVRRHTLEKLPPTPECFNQVLFEPGRLIHGISNDSLMDIDEMSESEELEGSCSVTVAVRVRPFSQRELSDGNVRCVVGMDGNQTTVTSDNGQNHLFNYDFSFWSFDDEHGDFASQESVYNTLARPLLAKAFEGYNTCLFAYGQTGSGKSYSIMGHGRDVGIIPRFSEELFNRMESTSSKQPVKMNVEISFFEIYNEKIHDLLASSKDKTGKKALKVREHPVLGPYVEGLSTFVVNSFEDIQGWITLGNKSRATAATGMNDKSSRSHSVFTLVLTQTKTEMLEGENHDHSTTSKINLVDLAGSERQSQAQTSGERLREGANINKSLMTLGKVISLLSERAIYKKKKVFIPYRDSVLTWLLKESLGGNSKTAMIATISPANHHTEETLSTLRYAKQARSIVNNVRVNEDPKARLIRVLRAEIDKLRGQTGVTNEAIHASSLAEITALKDKLMMKEKEVEEASRSWKEKLQRSVARKEQELKALEKAGVSFKVDNKLPNLVNLNEDPQLSEMLLYVLKEGRTKVGRLMDKSTHDIQLNGALIADDHCEIINEEKQVKLIPNVDAPTYVNGNLLTDTTILHHGDRVILGGDHYFRFNHPIEVQRQKKTNSGSTEIKDFEFAKQELMRVQESRLQEELEQAKKLAQEEMTLELEKIKKEAEQEFKAQKTGYEGKLANLETSLKTQKEKAEEAEKKAAELITKLQNQKMMLEQEVLAGKKRHQVELQSTQKVYCEVDWKRSKLLDLLESEKEKLSKKLEEAKRRRTEVPSPSKKFKVATVETGKTDLYKNALLISEANRIGHHLKKHTIFSRQDIMENEETKTFVKVTNTKLNICTYWPLAKFEEKLLFMRELYQGECENSAVDEVFYDPTDSWEKENGYNSPRTSRGSRSSTNNRRLSIIGTPLLNSTRRSSCGSQRTDSASEGNKVSSIASLTRGLLTLAIDRLKVEGSTSKSVADEMLMSADNVKLAVSAIIDAPNTSRESTSADPDSVPRNLFQLLNSYQVLTSLASLWSSLYRAVDSPLIQDLTEKIVDLVKVLGNHMGLFLQGCENEIDSMVQESGYKILTTLFSLCRNCGELALATDTPMTTLSSNGRSESSDQEFSGTIMLGSEVRQAFLGGCDVFVDKTLQGGIKTLEESESKAQRQTEDVMKNSAVLGVLPVNIEMLMASSRVLLEKCQEIQVAVDTSLMENSDNKPTKFYQHSYIRSQRLVSSISAFIDSLNLLMQAADTVLQGSDGDLRKISRCSEMIQKAAHKLYIVSKGDSVIGRIPSTSSQSESMDNSVLSNTQLDQLSIFVQDVKFASNTLMEKVEKLSESDWSSFIPNRGKRMLPVSPDRVTLMPFISSKSWTIGKNVEAGND